MIVQFEKVHNDAIMPTKATFGSAGYDLYSCEPPLVLQAGEIQRVSTGLRVMNISSGNALLICSRSGLATKGVIAMNAPGIIDSDYDGILQIIMGNFGKESYQINPGDRIAQMLAFGLVQDVSIWDVTNGLTKIVQQNPVKRNGGFGSTGVR